MPRFVYKNVKKRKPVIRAISVLLIAAATFEIVIVQKFSNESRLEDILNRNLPEGHASPHNLFGESSNHGNTSNYLWDERNSRNEDKNIDSENVSPAAFTDEQMKLIQVAKTRGLRGVGDKGPILQLLTQAGIQIEGEKGVDQETLDRLPTWTQIQNFYGSEPKVIGLEKCEAFRDAVDPAVRYFGIAGTFNTGTNLAADLMKFNCQITERMEAFGSKSKGVRWQVPWGKHFMARYRQSNHSTRTDKDVPKNNVLPVVSIRDPFSWMQSMCRHTYRANWPHKEKHCPNLIATEIDIRFLPRLHKLYGEGDGEDEEKLVPVTVRYDEDLVIHHKSLAHFYSEWYNEYLEADFPRIMVRFEDLLFHGEEVIRKICECGGGVPVPDNQRSGRFAHVSKSAKKGASAHGDAEQRTNLIGALIRYGSYTNRTDSMTEEDLAAMRRYLDPKLMEVFGYWHPEQNGL